MLENRKKTKKQLKKEAWKAKQKLEPVKIKQSYCKKNRMLLKLTCLAISLADEHKKEMLAFVREQIYKSFLVYKEPLKLSQKELESFDQGVIRFFIHYGWISEAPVIKPEPKPEPILSIYEIRRDWVYKHHVSKKTYLPHIHVNWLNDPSYKEVKEYIDFRAGG